MATVVMLNAEYVMQFQELFKNVLNGRYFSENSFPIDRRVGCFEIILYKNKGCWNVINFWDVYRAAMKWVLWNTWFWLVSRGIPWSDTYRVRQSVWKVKILFIFNIRELSFNNNNL